MMRWMYTGLGLLAIGCQDLPIDKELRNIDSPRILAIRPTPFVAHDGDTLNFEAYVVNGVGERVMPDIEWRICDPQGFANTFEQCEDDKAFILSGNSTSVLEVAQRFPGTPPCQKPECEEEMDHCGVAYPKFIVRVMAKATVEGEEIIAVRDVGGTPFPLDDFEREITPTLVGIEVERLTGGGGADLQFTFDGQASDLYTCPPDEEINEADTEEDNDDGGIRTRAYLRIYGTNVASVIDPRLLEPDDPKLIGDGYEGFIAESGFGAVTTLHVFVYTPRGQVNWYTVPVPQ